MSAIFKKVAEEFNLPETTVHKIAVRTLDVAIEEAAEKGHAFLSRKHYFKKIDHKPRKYHDIRTGEMKEAPGYTSVEYKNRLS